MIDPNELRRIADIELTGYSEDMMRQAADEIERLRAALTKIASRFDDYTYPNTLESMTRQEALDALNQQKMQCAECDCKNPPDGCNWMKPV